MFAMSSFTGNVCQGSIDGHNRPGTPYPFEPEEQYSLRPLVRRTSTPVNRTNDRNNCSACHLPILESAQSAPLSEPYRNFPSAENNENLQSNLNTVEETSLLRDSQIDILDQLDLEPLSSSAVDDDYTPLRSDYNQHMSVDQLSQEFSLFSISDTLQPGTENMSCNLTVHHQHSIFLSTQDLLQTNPHLHFLVSFFEAFMAPLQSHDSRICNNRPRPPPAWVPAEGLPIASDNYNPYPYPQVGFTPNPGFPDTHHTSVAQFTPYPTPVGHGQLLVPTPGISYTSVPAFPHTPGASLIATTDMTMSYVLNAGFAYLPDPRFGPTPGLNFNYPYDPRYTYAPVPGATYADAPIVIYAPNPIFTHPPLTFIDAPVPASRLD